MSRLHDHLRSIRAHLDSIYAMQEADTARGVFMPLEQWRELNAARGRLANLEALVDAFTTVDVEKLVLP